MLSLLDIEVYLGYPIKLKEKLGLSIDLSDMLYFACSGITELDLDTAYAYVTSNITPDTLADRLTKDDSWKKALQREKPAEMGALTSSYQETQDFEAYVAGYKALTISVLPSE